MRRSCWLNPRHSAARPAPDRDYASNSTRVSGIIDNILQLSRVSRRGPEKLMLESWTQRFREEFCSTVQLQWPAADHRPGLRGRGAAHRRSQLHQIFWNLCQNSVTHALPHAGGCADRAALRPPCRHRPALSAGRRSRTRHCPGDAERIFEPFFTRAAHGTGLGLFLARELGQANGRPCCMRRARAGVASSHRVC